VPPHHDPEPRDGLVTLPEAIMGMLTGKFGKISLYNQVTDFKSGSTSNSNSTPPGSLHASQLLSHRVRRPHCMSTSHMASATPVGPTRKLSLHARLARRSLPSTPRTPTSHPATTRTLRTSLTSGRTQPIPSSIPTRPRSRCQALLPAWSLHLLLLEDSSTGPIASLQT
jgi:hypothetical protein